MIDVRPDETVYLVRLADVPADVCLDAEARLDTLLARISAGGRADADWRSADPRAREWMTALVNGFADCRAAIRQQVAGAAAQPASRAQIQLQLTRSGIADGERFLEALNNIDGLPGADQPLPRADRVFYAWLVASLKAELDASANGSGSTARFSLERFLLDELSRLTPSQPTTALRRKLERMGRELATPTATKNVARVAVSECMHALGASGAAVWLATDEGQIVVPFACGDGVDFWDLEYAELAIATHPAARTLASGDPIWLETPTELAAASPELAAREPRRSAMCAVALPSKPARRGVLRLDFREPHTFTDDERTFVLEAAALTVQALERNERHAAERKALQAAEATTARLSRLTKVIGELAAARDVESIADIMVTHLADAIGASLSSLSLLVDAETLDVVRLRGAREETVRRWHRYPVAANLPGSEAVRTRQPVYVADTAELVRRYPDLQGQAISDRALYCLPLLAADQPIGVASLSFPAGHCPDAAEAQFLATLAETCAQSLERARAMTNARELSDKLVFLNEASAELLRSLDVRKTLGNIAGLTVGRLADWAIVHILEDGDLKVLAVAHSDPDRASWARQLQERYPVDPQADRGIAQVVRTGKSQLYPDVTDDMLVAAAVDEEHLRINRQLGMSSALIVPLTGRESTIGAITLVYAESGRRYDRADLALAEDLACRAGIAVENAKAFELQQGRLQTMTTVAEAAQHAILAPVPARIGRLRLDAAYVSAAKDAHVGGDLYEVISLPNSVRLIVGDVRGKGLAAVRLATVVLGHFRSAAADSESIAEVATQMDQRLRSYLGEEDFVTAVLADIGQDGSCEVVCCGHPPALLAQEGRIRELDVPPSLPLGLGAAPVPTHATLGAGDRLLLLTDGALEARRADGTYVEVMDIVAPLASGDHSSVLRRILHRLKERVGADLGDDLALLVAEFVTGQD